MTTFIKKTYRIFFEMFWQHLDRKLCQISRRPGAQVSGLRAYRAWSTYSHNFNVPVKFSKQGYAKREHIKDIFIVKNALILEDTMRSEKIRKHYAVRKNLEQIARSSIIS
jgi:hypothetical protein